MSISEIKGYYWWKYSFVDHAPGIWLPHGCKLAINWEKDNDVKIFWYYDIVSSFRRWCVSLVLFSYWSKFHVSCLVTGPSFMSISWLVLELWEFLFIQYWAEIWKWEILPSEIPNLWILVKVRDTEFGTNVSNKKLLNAGQDYRFYRIWVIRGKPKAKGLKLPTHHPD